MRTLVLYDDVWHPADIPQKGLEPLQNFGYAFDWIENASDWSEDVMVEYPVVILAKANNISSKNESPWMTGAIEQVFLKYVRRGNGLLVLHSGTAGYEKDKTLRRLMGGVFREHPEQRHVILNPKPGHVLTVGSEPLTVLDEHYFMDLDDPHVDIFLTTNSDYGTQPGGWTRIEGDGRVCVLTPGHTLETWRHPNYQILLQNSLGWCAKR